MLYSRISSGLDFLDAGIGGLFSNRCYLLRGPSQSGRTTAVIQFLIAGLENGENCMMISSDRIENVILKAEAIGISLEPYLLDNRLVLMEYPKEILSGNFQYGSVIQLLGEIEQYLRHYNCSRLVFDTLLPLLANPREADLVNYTYSLMNSLEALQVTTMVTTGEPSSPVAVRIIQLIEDAVVGSFALTVKSVPQGSDRSFIIYKMVNNYNPPMSFRTRMEYGVGHVQEFKVEEQLSEKASTQKVIRTLKELPLRIVLVDYQEDNVEAIEEIFSSESVITMVESAESLAQQIHLLDMDLLMISIDVPGLSWREMITQLREIYPKLPIFLLADKLDRNLNYQSAKQAGSDGLFVKPLVPEDVLKLLEKTLKGYNTLDELFEKRSAQMRTANLPDDLAGGEEAPSDASLQSEANLLSPQRFRDRLQRLILKRGGRDGGQLSLVAFKMIYSSEITKQPHLPKGLELVKKVAGVITTSLRGVNDNATRYMDKIVVLLDETDKEGAQAFSRRVIRQVKEDLSNSLNIQVGRHLNLLVAVASFPEDGDNVNELIAQVTEVSRNFVKSVAV